MSAKKYKQLLFDVISDLLWKQWSDLGIPGQVLPQKNKTILDPEALIIFSAGFARYDQRLYDLILDWLDSHSSQINVQRLKALHSKAEYQDTASLGYICSVIAEKDPARWRKLADTYSAVKKTHPVMLFKDSDDQPEKFIPECDQLALNCNFIRNIRRNSGKILPQLPQCMATRLLQMRSLLGISARAETILVLLSSEPCKVQDIVDRSGFIWKSIQDVLEELIAGNFVAVLNGTGRGKQYFLTDPEKILRFFDIKTPGFWNWSSIYDSIGLLWQLCSNPLLEKVSSETFKNEIRTLYVEKLQKKLLLSGCQELTKTVLDINGFPELIRSIGK